MRHPRLQINDSPGAPRERRAYPAPRAVAGFVLALGLALGVAACSGDEKTTDEPVSKGGGGGGSGDKGGGGGKPSGNRTTLANSLSNNPLTSLTINGSKAEAFGASDSKDKSVLEGKITADRLARKGVSGVMAVAKKIADLEMAKAPGKSVSDEVKLDIALTAIQNKNFALAEYYLQQLIESKNAKVKAGAYNALGVVALNDQRVPEAVLYFSEALKAVSNYKPAKYNLGFTALKGGDLGKAKSALGEYQSDWFVQYAMISIARMEGDGNRAAELCGKVFTKAPQHKAALFNCGLVEAQNRKNYAKAKEYMKKAQGAKGGESTWDERIVNMLTEVEMESQKAKANAPKPAAKDKGKGGGANPGSGSPTAGTGDAGAPG